MEKKLRLGSFAAHAARGLIRDQRTRRWTMFITLLGAMLIAFAGSTFVEINPREHPWYFVIFWLACAWLTVTALLLAAFDLLMVRAQSRAEKRKLRRDLSSTGSD